MFTKLYVKLTFEYRLLIFYGNIFVFLKEVHKKVREPRQTATLWLGKIGGGSSCFFLYNFAIILYKINLERAVLHRGRNQNFNRTRVRKSISY